MDDYSPSTLGELLEIQAALQEHSFQSIQSMDQDERIAFLRWNFLACMDELHEAMAEIGWKPWATSRHINSAPFTKEMVDAFHFFMNLLIAANPDKNPTQIGEMFSRLYYLKSQKNAQRQRDGYDGVSTKCPNCHRDLEEVEKEFHHIDDQDVTYCSLRCLKEDHEE